MKRRRLVIGAFLLVAVLVMGVGYAAVSGQLNIRGSAVYNGPSEVAADTHSAVHFLKATALTPADDAVQVTAGISATDTTNDTANIQVIISDSDGTPDREFVAQAEYIVVFEEGFEAANLPVTFSANPSSDNPNFVVTYAWSNADEVDYENGTVSGNNATLVPGSAIKLTVTVTYTTQDPAIQNVDKANNIIITLPYAE